MAFPTSAQLNFVDTSPGASGFQPIMSTSTTQKHPLGTRIRGVDIGSLGYGEAEFIYLKGVASTAAGDCVTYDPVAGTTVRTVAASRGPVAIAMSANVANQYGWYMIWGQAPVNTTAAGTGAANAALDVTATDGQLTVGGTTAYQGVQGAICKAAQGTPTTGFTQVSLAYPCVNGITAHA